MSEHYDIIGDIHGHAVALEALLGKLGYVEIGGIYRHPEERRVIFLGDYIDRGPDIRRVLQIVRSMVEAGAAMAILGNHEVNALRYHARDGTGLPLRVHGSKNRSQHQATLDQIAAPAPDEWRGWLTWFSRLPLWLDLGGLRAVHASWDDDAMASLRNVGPLVEAVLERFSRKGTADYDAISRLINGPEAKLLNGHRILLNGVFRKEIRVRWWDEDLNGNAQDVAYPGNPVIPPVPILAPKIRAYQRSAPPVFFGHYTIPSAQYLVAPNAACLDFGCGKGGRLAGYRWDGEKQIDSSKISVVESGSATELFAVNQRS